MKNIVTGASVYWEGAWPSVFGLSLYVIGEVESGYNNFALGGDCAMSKLKAQLVSGEILLGVRYLF